LKRKVISNIILLTAAIDGMWTASGEGCVTSPPTSIQRLFFCKQVGLKEEKEIILIRYIKDKIESVIVIHSHCIKRMINAIQLGIYLEKNVFQCRKTASRHSLQFHALREYAYFQFSDLFYFA